MKLDNKKELASRTLKVGKNRIIFNTERIKDIKEAITRQDIKDLLKDNIITIREIKGRRKIVKRKTRRRAGSKRKTVNTRKQDYVKLTRRLRAYLASSKNSDKISKEGYVELRKEIRAGNIRSLAQMKERIKEFVK